MAKLTAAEVRGFMKKPGKHGDGDGLTLVVATAGRGSWVFRYMLKARAREMSLGNAEHISLAEAREKAAEARKLLRGGTDPLDQRRAKEAEAETAKARATTFTEAAADYIAAHEPSWRSPVHCAQWKSTLATYAEPIIGPLPVCKITTDHILAVLKPIWVAKPETASRVRGRIETILDFAKARGWRDREAFNPAMWRGHLQLMLPATGKVRKVEHHAALDWREAPGFMRELRQRDSFGARALEFAILTAARSGEVRGARWDEINLGQAIWTIPADRMKGGRMHRLPLSEPALAILHRMAELKDGSGLVFLGQKFGTPLSNMTLTAVLRRMGWGELTAHGFRSTFRDWAAEATHHPNHVVEQALAHTIGDKVEAAYRRGDLFEKRVQLMDDWSAFLARPAATVIRLRKPADTATALAGC